LVKGVLVFGFGLNPFFSNVLRGSWLESDTVEILVASVRCVARCVHFRNRTMCSLMCQHREHAELDEQVNNLKCRKQ
jgi:hypothetical protein